jgi:hypothetical protein
VAAANHESLLRDAHILVTFCIRVSFLPSVRAIHWLREFSRVELNDYSRPEAFLERLPDSGFRGMWAMPAGAISRGIVFY